MKITCEKDALAVWDSFYQVQDIVYDKQGFTKSQIAKYVGKQPIKPEIIEKWQLQEETGLAYKGITKIQKKWKALRETDTQIPVNPKGLHTKELLHLLHNQKITKSINRKKLEQLETALNPKDLNKNVDWKNEIFSDKDLVRLAFNLFDAGKITQQQIFTLLRHDQIAKDLPIKNIYQILNADNSFTEEAKNYLFPIITESELEKPLPDKELEQFRLLVASLPKSEQIFYFNDNDITKIGSLGRQYIANGTIWQRVKNPVNIYSNEMVHPSVGVADALGIIRYGLDKYRRRVPMLGSFTIEDIEHGVKRKVRYLATQYPGTIPYKDIHGGYARPFEAASHDDLHGIGMCNFPIPFENTLQRFIDVTRKVTGFQWSKEIWGWVDRNYNFGFYPKGKKFHPELLTPEENSEFLCKVFAGSNDGNISDGGILNFLSPTIVGIIVMIDMIENPNPDMNPSGLIFNFKKYYETITTILPDFAKDDINIKVLKCMLYFDLDSSHMTDYFPLICKAIDNNKDHFSKTTKFNKTPKTGSDQKSYRNANLIVLDYDAKRLYQEMIKIVRKNNNELPKILSSDNHSFGELYREPKTDHDRIIHRLRKYGIMTISDAIKEDDCELVNFLIADGENINTVDEVGNSPLHYAVQSRQTEVVALLLTKNANIFRRNTEGDCPINLLELIRDKSDQMIFKLLAEPLLNDHQQLIAQLNKHPVLLVNFYLAAFTFWPEQSQNIIGILDKLINEKLINIQFEGGNNLLHFAAVYNEEKLMKHFLKHETNINQANKSGQTPLITAAVSTAITGNGLSIVELLLANGADTSVKYKKMSLLEYLGGRDYSDLVIPCIENHKNTSSIGLGMG